MINMNDMREIDLSSTPSTNIRQRQRKNHAEKRDQPSRLNMMVTKQNKVILYIIHSLVNTVG